MESVSHKGKIIGITPETTSVEIISESACASCHAKGLCGMSEHSSKVIEVPSDPFVIYELGEEVNVVLKASMGHKAVFIAYVGPLIVLTAVLLGLLGLLGLGVAELVAGVSAFAAIAVYYLFIRLLRDRLKSEYVFKIEKQI